MPLVSVIIPNYNHAQFLKQRIDSVLNQTFQDFELIILDDASTDQSIQILDSYKTNPKVSQIIFNIQNSGSTFIQWEKGLKLAKGEYIWIAESDDYAGLTFLETQLDSFIKNPELVISYSPSVWINDKSETIEVIDFESIPYIKSGSELIKNEFLKGCMVYNTSSALFSAKMAKEINFDEIKKFRFTGDWLFWVKLAAKGNVVRIAKPLNFFRRHDKNVSFKAEKEGLMYTEGFKVLKYIFENNKISFFKKQSTILYWALKIYKNNDQNHADKLVILSPYAKFWLYLCPALSKLKGNTEF